MSNARIRELLSGYRNSAGLSCAVERSEHGFQLCSEMQICILRIEIVIKTLVEEKYGKQACRSVWVVRSPTVGLDFMYVYDSHFVHLCTSAKRQCVWLFV